MNKIERGLWLAVAIVFGNLGGTAYQKYVVPKQTPVQYERKGEVRKAAEAPEADEQQAMAVLLLYLLMQMGVLEIEVEPAQPPPPVIEDGQRDLSIPVSI